MRLEQRPASRGALAADLVPLSWNMERFCPEHWLDLLPQESSCLVASSPLACIWPRPLPRRSRLT